MHFSIKNYPMLGYYIKLLMTFWWGPNDAKWDLKWVFSFHPRPVLAFGYHRCLRLCVCQSVSLCVNHLLVRAITRDQFKLGSPNLKHWCKRPWLRSLLFLGGVIDLYLQGQIYLQNQNLPRFELVRAITHHLFKLGPPNLDQRCKIPWLRSILFRELIELDMSNQIYF